MSDNKYERVTVSVQKQIRRSEMNLGEKRSRRVMLRLKTGLKLKAFNTMCNEFGSTYKSY